LAIIHDCKATIGTRSGSTLKSTCMPALFIRATGLLERFSAWFDRRFGWFFTNGMKNR
jgi:hypothetical protein